MTQPAGLGAIIFDCDGVLLESVDVKTQAYRTLFADEPAHLDAILSYHLAHGGVSRFEKIRHIHAHILRRPLPDARLAELCDRFAALSLDGVLAAPLVPGTRELLKLCSGRVPLFVASGTPQGELETVLRHKGLLDHFEAVFGAPLTKVDIVGRVLSQRALAPSEVLVVGDALTDRDAARAFGIRFIARVGADRHDPFAAEAGLERVENLEKLVPLLRDLLGAR